MMETMDRGTMLMYILSY